jgi:hypothetical protein
MHSWPVHFFWVFSMLMFTRQQALQIARTVLRENAEKLYGWGESEGKK